MTDPLDNGVPDSIPGARSPDPFRGPDAEDRATSAPSRPPFPPVPPDAAAMPTRSSTPARRSSAWRLAGWWLLVSFVLLVVGAVCAGIALSHSDLQPVHVVIDGDDVGGGFTIEGAGAWTKVLLGVAGLAAGMLALLLVPVVLTVVAGIVVLALVVGLGVPLVAIALAMAVATSPIWLIALLAWFLARRRRAFAHATSATMRP